MTQSAVEDFVAKYLEKSVIKKDVKFMSSIPFRLILNILLRRLSQAACVGAASQPPRASMRSLLQIDGNLTWYINQVALRYDDGVHVKHRLMMYHDLFVERVYRNENVFGP